MSQHNLNDSVNFKHIVSNSNSVGADRLRPQVGKPVKTVPHDQCEAKPTVTSPAAQRRRPLSH